MIPLLDLVLDDCCAVRIFVSLSCFWPAFTVGFEVSKVYVHSIILLGPHYPATTPFSVLHLVCFSFAASRHI
jgi:hypothetical protein